MATGRVEQGTIKVGEEVEVLGLTQVRACNFLCHCNYTYFPCDLLELNTCLGTYVEPDLNDANIIHNILIIFIQS